MFNLFKTTLRTKASNTLADVSRTPRKNINIDQAIYDYGVSAAGHQTIFSKVRVKNKETNIFSNKERIEYLMSPTKRAVRDEGNNLLSLFLTKSNITQQTIPFEHIKSIHILNFRGANKELEHFPSLYALGKYFENTWFKTHCKTYCGIDDIKFESKKAANDIFNQFEDQIENEFDGRFCLEYYANNFNFENTGIAHRFTLMNFLNKHYKLNRSITAPLYTVKMNSALIDCFDKHYKSYLIALPTTEDMNNFNDMVEYTQNPIKKFSLETPIYGSHCNQYIFVYPRINHGLSNTAIKWIHKHKADKKILSIAGLLHKYLAHEEKNIKSHKWATSVGLS